MFIIINTDIETDKELRTMKLAYQLLQNVDRWGQERIINWLQSKLGSDTGAGKQGAVRQESVAADQSESEASSHAHSQANNQPRPAPTRLPVTDREKVLAAAIALAEAGTVQFTSRQISQKLKEVGIVISNLTRTMTELVSTRPPLLVQLRKQGRTMQGRRLFMLSSHGRTRAAGLGLGY
jgi:hypothetical protein